MPAKAEDEELIRMSILQILSTQRGERVMRPTFGANVWKFVFANNTAFLGDLIRNEVRSAIGRWEPRVAVQNISIDRVESEITITVEYVIRATGRLQTVEVTEATPR